MGFLGNRSVGGIVPDGSVVPTGAHRAPRAQIVKILPANRGEDLHKGMVGTAGFEPTTSASRTLRATKLRHVPCSGDCSRGQTSAGRETAWRNCWAVKGFTT